MAGEEGGDDLFLCLDVLCPFLSKEQIIKVDGIIL